MDKIYNPQAIEAQWYQRWERRGYFKPTGDSVGYCIMLPPPNVTGSLHLGHAFQHTLMDILIRYHRMKGDKVLWQCGTDHAGIATQMVVERQLEHKGINRHQLGRKKFTQAVWDWKAHSGNGIASQIRQLGHSMDWSRERFTLDQGLSRAVQTVFIQLYREGLIYRGHRLVNWDPVLLTAISDLEVISTEEEGHLWHIRYPIVGETDQLVVATTRPETMLGDAAVAVHPDDHRYLEVIGKEVALPLTGRTIPIIADDYVDPEFGTGCLKITPAHDFNDYEVGLRHDLPLINIFTAEATINEHAPKNYQGLDRYAARKKIVGDLAAAGLLEKTKPHQFMVPRGDRSHAVIEPYLTDQWYVKIRPLAEPAIKAVTNGDIEFIPGNWSKTYFEWMRNINDWCISRQLWWGHRIPAWYDEQGNTYVGASEAEVRRHHKLTDKIKLVQDQDVLDTWFSSALWPFSTLGWPEKTQDLEAFYSTDVLVTGFDIIFFWVARMIMMSLKFTGKVPFKAVYVHGLIRDAQGQKMSKSKGNILDPIDLINGIDLESLVKKRTKDLMNPRAAPEIEAMTRKHFPQGVAHHGADALRFTLASLATLSRDLNFDPARVGGSRNFCNKLWNAARYVLMNLAKQEEANITPTYGLAERWIMTHLAHTIEQVTKNIHAYRFDLAAKLIYEFTWDEYCDWYLELSKIALNDDTLDASTKLGTRLSLLRALEILTRLAHPFMPFITEEIWQRVAPRVDRQGATIMYAPYPSPDEIDSDESSIAEINWIKEFILGVRRIRAEKNIDPRKPLPVQTKDGNAQEKNWLKRNTTYLYKLGKIESITEVNDAPDESAVALAGEMLLFLPLADLIDPAMELNKLAKQLSRLERDRTTIEKKLENTHFIERAPKSVVNQAKQRFREIESAITKLQGQHRRVKNLT